MTPFTRPKADYGYAPSASPKRIGRSPDSIEGLPRDAGFTDINQEIERYETTVHQVRAWLSIPIFAGAFAGTPEEHRLDVIEKAHRNADRDQVSMNSWLIMTAR